MDIEYEPHFYGFLHSLSFAVPQVNWKVDELTVLANEFLQSGLIKILLSFFLHEQAKIMYTTK